MQKTCEQHVETNKNTAGKDESERKTKLNGRQIICGFCSTCNEKTTKDTSQKINIKNIKTFSLVIK